MEKEVVPEKIVVDWTRETFFFYDQNRRLVGCRFPDKPDRRGRKRAGRRRRTDYFKYLCSIAVAQDLVIHLGNPTAWRGASDVFLDRVVEEFDWELGRPSRGTYWGKLASGSKCEFFYADSQEGTAKDAGWTLFQADFRYGLGKRVEVSQGLWRISEVEFIESHQAALVSFRCRVERLFNDTERALLPGISCPRDSQGAGIRDESQRAHTSRPPWIEPLEEIRLAQERLQVLLGEGFQRAAQLVGGVRVVAAWAHSLASGNPQVAELARALEALVRDFELGHESARLTVAEQRQLRSAKATAALALGRPREALELVPEDEAVSTDGIEASQVDRVVQANVIRGDAYYALGHWREALACYDRALRLGSDTPYIRTVTGNCLYYLGRWRAAMKHLDEAIARWRQAGPQTDDRVQLSLAGALTNRANNLIFLDRCADAVSECSEALAIYERLQGSGGRALAGAMAVCLMNRGIALNRRGAHEDAFRDQRRAVLVCARAARRRRDPQLESTLADALTNYAGTATKIGRHARAARVSREAVRLYAKLLQREEASFLRPSLATALNYHGIASDLGGDTEAALRSWQEAVDVFTTLVEVEGQGELSASFADCLSNRAIALWKRDQYGAAIEEYTRSLRIRLWRCSLEQRRASRDSTAKTLVNRGIAFADSGDLEQALKDLWRARRIFEALIQKYGRSDLGRGRDLCTSKIHEVRRLLSTRNDRSFGL